MKKALTLVVLIVTPSIIFAQGTVSIGNQTGRVQRWTSAYDSTLVPVPKGGGYVELIATTKGNPLLHPLGVYQGSSGFLPGYSSLAGFLAANPGWAVASGQYNPGPIGFGPGVFANGNATIGNIGEGADADYVVIGWTGPYATYDAAYAADLANPNSSFLGMSGIATTQTGDPMPFGGPPDVPVNLKVTFQGMTLAPAVIPEPTTVLLAGLGAALLLLFRRR
jgi:PEP-CTERM motif